MSYTASQMPEIITEDYTIQPYDVFIRYSAPYVEFAPLINFQLPDPSLGRRVILIANTISIASGGGMGYNLIPYGSELINGVAGTWNVYGGYYVVTLTSDLTNWYADGGQSPQM